MKRWICINARKTSSAGSVILLFLKPLLTRIRYMVQDISTLMAKMKRMFFPNKSKKWLSQPLLKGSCLIVHRNC